MSLNLALAAAVSSLGSVQKQMAVASNNIANANTTGYSKETVTVASAVSGGVGAGVDDLGITINVDRFLLQSVVNSSNSSAEASTYASYYDSLQQALGTITSSDTGGSDLTSQLSTLETALNSLSDNPDQSSLRTKVVNALDSICANLRTTSSTIQSLRNQADLEIQTTVADINTQLNTIKTLNASIAQSRALGQPTASFEDQRNNALQALSQDTGVTYFVDQNDQMQIYTSAGQMLLDGTTLRTMSYTASTTIVSTVTYPSGGISGVMLGGSDITPQLGSSGGKLQALIQQRDTELPAAQSALDNLASSLTSTINSVYNTGTASPATSPVTGTNTTALTGATAVTVGAGTTVRIAMVDSTGTIQSYHDVALPTGATTVTAIMNAINTAFAPSSVASLNGSGQLVLTSSVAGCGVSVATVSGTVGGTNFSSYFDLHDLIATGTKASSIAVLPSYLSTPSLLSPSKLSTTSTTMGITAGDGSIATSLSNALLGSQSFSAAGHLPTTTATFASYASSIIADVATRASNAADDKTTKSTTLSTLKSNLSSSSGVNTDEETASLVTLQSTYSASAKVVSTVQTMFSALLDAVK